jgi:putative heme-binding domain-containing protein
MHRLTESQSNNLTATLLSVESDPQHQALAARVLQRQQLTPESATRLLESLQEVPPMYWGVAMAAVIRDVEDATLSRVIAVAELHPLARSFDFTPLRQRLAGLTPAAVEPLDKLLVSFAAAQQDQQAIVQDRLAALPDGDPLRGMQIFRDGKTACSGCHRIGYVGGEIGPNLSRIAASRTRSDLLEAILFPSARQEQSYRTVSILTTNGNVVSGLVSYEDNQVVELTTGLDQKARVQRGTIERMQPGEVSLMPAGLADHLTIQELADLLAFLQTHR